MSKEKTYDPFDGIKRMTEMWENQLNGLLYMMTDNNEFVRLLKVGTEGHARYMELLRKNQELLAGIMNIPTKKDVANVAKLSVQAEEKIDLLEEQIWTLQDSLGLVNKDNLKMFKELVNVVKQMKSELEKMALEVTEAQSLKKELQELRQGLVDIKMIQLNLQELRKEIVDLKGMKEELLRLNDSSKNTTVQTDLQEIKEDLHQLAEIKTELVNLKGLLPKGRGKDKDKDKELVLAGEGVSKS